MSEWPAKKDQPTEMTFRIILNAFGGAPLNKAGSLLLDLLYSEAFQSALLQKVEVLYGNFINCQTNFLITLNGKQPDAPEKLLSILENP